MTGSCLADNRADIFETQCTIFKSCPLDIAVPEFYELFCETFVPFRTECRYMTSISDLNLNSRGLDGGNFSNLVNLISTISLHNTSFPDLLSN